MKITRKRRSAPGWRAPSVLGAVLVVAAGVGCSRIPKPPQDAPPEMRMRYGYALLADGATYDARQVFEELTLVAPGSAIIDSVRYGLGETYFEESNFYQARAEYQSVVSSFPRSPLVDDAAYKVGLCFWNQSLGHKLDQSETLQAIDAFRGFLIDYPTSEHADEVDRLLGESLDKLAHKKLYEGQTYYKLGTPRDMDAAAIQLSELIQQYPSSKWVDEGLLLLAKVYLKQSKTSEARQVLAALVAQFPDSEVRDEGQELLRQIGLPPDQPPPAIRP